MASKEGDGHDEMVREMGQLHVCNASQGFAAFQHVPLGGKGVVRGILDITLDAYAKQRKQFHVSDVSGKAALNEAGDKLLFFNIMQFVITLMGESSKLFLNEEFEVCTNRKTRADLVLMDESRKNILLVVEVKTIQVQYLVPLQSGTDVTRSVGTARRFIEEEFVKRECGPEWNELKSFQRIEKYCKSDHYNAQSNSTTGLVSNASPKGRSIDEIFREAREQIQNYCEDAKKNYHGVDKAIKMILCTVGPFVYKMYA